MNKKGFFQLVLFNNKIEKKMGTVFLWDAESVAVIILNNMIEEAGKNYDRYNGLASFIAYRLKFADEKTINFMSDAIFDKEKHFTEKVSGKYTLFETMQIYNCDYFQALLIQYKNTQHAKDSKFTCEYRLPDCISTSEPFKTKCSKLSDDGKEIIFMSVKDWESEYGPIIVDLSKVDENDPFIKKWIEKHGEPIGPRIIRCPGKYESSKKSIEILNQIRAKYE